MREPLSEAQEFARAALVAVTPESTIGAFTDEVDEGDGVTSYRFETTMPGYPGWNWTATIARLADAEPTIVETELVPAEGALLAPDWIPWSDRMDDYRAAQAALGDAAAAESEIAGDADEDDDDDDEFGSDTLHGGDLDGVDIDELDVPALGVDEADEAEGEPDGAGEEPPVAPARRKRVRKEQQHDQGD